MKELERFTNTYSVSKTLRFELIPVGKTRENIERKGIIDADTKLAESYQKMKKTIDEFHKYFIDDALTGAKLTGLADFYALYTAGAEEKKTEEHKKNYKAVKDSLRKEVVAYFKKHETFKILGSDKLIREKLQPWIIENRKRINNDNLATDEEIKDFYNFTTYFTGYHENRKNMYSEEEKATAVSHRLIDENLPKFIDNIRIFRLVKDSPVAESFAAICADMEPWLNVATLDNLFVLQNYNYTLTQAQIEAYNVIIGGRSEESRKVKGLNEYINLYNQKNPDHKLPKFKMLYKQILSDRSSASWLPESFDTADEMLDAVNRFYADYAGHMKDGLQQALRTLPECDLERIYIRNDGAITDISNRLFEYYGVLKDALGIDPEDKKKQEYYSIAQVQTALDTYIAESDAESNPQLFAVYDEDCIADYFVDGVCRESSEIIANIEKNYESAKDLLNTAHSGEYQLTQAEKDGLKAFLDSLMALLHFVKPLYLKPSMELPKDDVFYGAFIPAFEQMQPLTKLYDKVRNFVTKKPYSTEKVKLNFATNKGNLLNGWTDSKTDNSDNGTQCGGYLFRKKNSIDQYDYYLGVSANVKLFRSFNDVIATRQSEYERLDYYQVKGQTVYGSSYKGNYAEDKSALLGTMVAFSGKSKNGFLKSEIAEYCNNDKATPSGCIKIFQNYPQEYQKLLMDREFSQCNQTVIDHLKQTMQAMYRVPKAKEIAGKNYTVFSDMMTDIKALESMKIFHYFPVDKDELTSALNDEKRPLFLFKISNKDLSFAEKSSQGLRKSHGKDNLHTMYFKALMSGEQSIYDLGTAEVFYRKASIDEKSKTVHQANIPIEKKNPKLKGQYSTFDYDITKDRRYTVDKYQLHLSIMCNYSAPPKPKKFNESVCAYLKNNPDVNVIGIDRGERHLLYLSMIDRNGNVVKDKNGKYIQYSLNTVTGEYKGSDGQPVKFETPYRELLDEKEEKRKKAREAWGTIENIKELKAGYLSQVVHHIAKLMVEHNAIVVLEDLNGGFKNGRKKVEKQAYQNFEKALIEKLNYLVFKDAPADEPGGLYRALQLTDKFDSFKKLTKQSGFLFYVPAWNTSKIDPVTGFVDLLKPKTGMSMKEAKTFYGKFDSIRYNAEKDYFEFAFDYVNFTEKAEGSRTQWTVCTHGELRYAYNRSLNNGKGGYEKWNVTEMLKELFMSNGVDYRNGDLRDAIIAQSSAGFFARLTKLLQVTLAMRYSSTEDGKDFILSPVANEHGEFYCSEGREDGLPQDADANGAFNIARKGLWVLEQIDKADKYTDWSTRVSNRDWLDYVQTRFC